MQDPLKKTLSTLGRTIEEITKSKSNCYYYDLFFSFRDLTKKMILNFFRDEENRPNFERIYAYLRKQIAEHIEEQIALLDWPFQSLYGLLELIDRFYSDFGHFFKMLTKYIFYSLLDEDLKFDSHNVTIGKSLFSLNVNQKLNSLRLYRGQSNFSWGIQPSLIRDLKPLKLRGLYLNSTSLECLYAEHDYKNSLLNKYMSCFGNKASGNIIDYKFLAWMQHAIAFSPLLDFTTSLPIAITFAVPANNPNYFSFTDSAIYTLDVSYKDNIYLQKDEKKLNSIIKDMYIVYLGEKIRIGSYKTVFDCKGEPHYLDFTSYKKVLDQILPKYLIIDIPTNDRMRCQKGKFLLFYDYVSVNGEMFAVMDDRLSLEKYRIPIILKAPLLETLNSLRPNIRKSYLMNPYTIFDD